MQKGSTGCRVAVLNSVEEIESLREFWTNVQWNPELDIDFVSFIVCTRPGIICPYVIVVYDNDKPVTLLAGRIENGSFEAKLGYKTIWRRKVRQLGIFYGGLMGRTDPETIKLVLRQLLCSLRKEQIDLLFWSGVRRDGDLQNLLRLVPNVLCRDHLSRPVQHWTMTLPGSVEELLEKRMNKKHRYWAKRTMRALEKDFPGAVRLGCFLKPNEVEKLFADVLVVARKTYQWGLGVGFQDNEEMRKRLKLEAGKGWHRGYVLYLKEQPIAFWICVVYKGTAYSAFTGYDPAFRKYEIGTGLFLRMIGELCKEGVKELDFGPGSAFYKERFGDASFEETTISIFACNIRGVSLNMARLVLQGPVDVARRLISRLGWEQKIKRLWRAHRTPAREIGEANPSQD